MPLVPRPALARAVARRAALALLAAAPVLLAACNRGGGTTTEPTQSRAFGFVEVRAAGLPAGAGSDVLRVTGGTQVPIARTLGVGRAADGFLPSSYNGVYSVEIYAVTAGGVRYQPNRTSDRLEVRSGETSVLDVAYARAP